ncbi:MAG TPA: hypothetical protein VFU62_07920 [Hanamia sp.]|nr:hypothetical protein [Hanamia sp.]
MRIGNRQNFMVFCTVANFDIMNTEDQKLDEVISMLQYIQREIQLQKIENYPLQGLEHFLHVPFRGPEIYLLHKAFIDSGGAPAETYKSLMERTAKILCNKNQKGFSLESLQKNSDKMNYEVKENVKRFLQKMIRNIDSY